MFDYIKPRHKKHFILFQSAGYFLRQCEKCLLMPRLCQNIQTLHCSTAVLLSQGQSFLQTFDCETLVLARSTSPGLANFLMISGSSSGNSWQANKTGPVASPSPRSATLGLPSTEMLTLNRRKSSYQASLLLR